MCSAPTIKLTKITPKEYAKFPKLRLTYGTTSTKFGNCLAAFRNDALCYLSFYDEKEPKFEELKKMWPNCPLHEDNASVSKRISRLFDDDSDSEICVKGTAFEMRVWEALLGVKKGTTMSYEGVAAAAGNVKAVRAAARAVAKNHVAYFIPCHRVIKKDGSVHKYGGGVDRKVKMLKDEGAI